jgi:hypothetical protein
LELLRSVFGGAYFAQTPTFYDSDIRITGGALPKSLDGGMCGKSEAQGLQVNTRTLHETKDAPPENSKAFA